MARVQAVQMQAVSLLKQTRNATQECSSFLILCKRSGVQRKQPLGGKSQTLGSYPSWGWTYQAGGHSECIELFPEEGKK